VGVQVDEPRCDDAAGEVEHGPFRRRGVTSQDVGHPITVEDEGYVWPHFPGHDVGEPAAPSGNERVSCYESSHGAEPATGVHDLSVGAAI
jgi:hypothetical protein